MTSGRRTAGALALALAWLLGSPPVGADPARPTDYRSEVTAVAPRVPGLVARVTGGDAFMELVVRPGLRVIVPDYQGRPYLRFLADGTVEENQRSEATYVNRSRFGRVELPAGFDASGPPVWRAVASDGAWAWHDHRVHFMGRIPSPDLRRGEARRWTLPLEVDGRSVAVQGRYQLLSRPSPLPWVALVVVVAGGAIAVGRRRPQTVALILAGGAAAAALAVGWRQQTSIPAGAGGQPLDVALPSVAVVAAVVGSQLRSTAARTVATLAAASSLAGWVLTRWTGLVRRVLPTDLAPNLDRAGTALALAAAIAAATLAVRSGGLALPNPGPAPGTAPAPREDGSGGGCDGSVDPEVTATPHPSGGGR